MREAIPSHLPHRPPFLLVDRILERVPGKRVRAMKLISGDPPCPPILMLEMLAQAGAFLEETPLTDQPAFLAQILDVSIHGAPAPGDRLELDIAHDAAFGDLTRFQGSVSCEGRSLCTARLLVKRGEGRP